MRHWVRAWLLAWTVCAVPCAHGAEEDALGPEPIATRQTAFSIPFQVDPTAATVPVEVQLHVSADRGVRWDLYDKVKPDRGSFVFRAPHDGEYWFGIRSVDRQGNVAPGGPLMAGMKVIVDTLAPRLDVTAERMPAGELSAQWQVVDPSLKPDSLKIEYRADDTAEWRELAASQARITEGRSTLTGDGVWWPQDVPGAITLRIQVTDRAGNPAVTQVKVKPPGGVAARPSADADGPSLSMPAKTGEQRDAQPALVARREGRTLPISTAAEKDTNVSNNPFDRYRDRSAPTTDPPAATAPPSEPPPPSRPWPAQGAASRPLNPATADGTSNWRVGNRPGGNASPGFVHTASSDPHTMRNRTTEVDGRGALGRPANTGFDFGDLSPAERPKMVNSRTFQIDYEIESVGSAGVAKVELFGTRDGGQSWISLGTDPDNRSPLVATVNGEGLYGFGVVVQSSSGLSGSPPHAGQRPELWIGVDLTKPEATITGAEPGNSPDELVIYWDARDRRLESRPIALFFSDRPGGNWTSIAAGLEHTGSYVWRMDSRVKDKIYLKLEVRDEAGNIGVFESPEPISLNRQLPQGRIRGVRPVGPESSDDQAHRAGIIYNEFLR